jgi:hypothetical protein
MTAWVKQLFAPYGPETKRVQLAFFVGSWMLLAVAAGLAGCGPAAAPDNGTTRGTSAQASERDPEAFFRGMVIVSNDLRVKYGEVVRDTKGNVLRNRAGTVVRSIGYPGGWEMGSSFGLMSELPDGMKLGGRTVEKDGAYVFLVEKSVAPVMPETKIHIVDAKQIHPPPQGLERYFSGWCKHPDYPGWSVVVVGRFPKKEKVIAMDCIAVPEEVYTAWAVDPRSGKIIAIDPRKVSCEEYVPACDE